MASVSGAPVGGLSPLAGVARGGQRIGRQGGAAGVTISEVTGVTIASLAARRGASAELAAKVQALLGIALPSEPKRAASGNVSVVWSGPDQWLVLFAGDARERVGELARALAGLGSVTDQSDSRAVINVSGPRARDALAKGVMVDLYPKVFATGDTAVTPVAHVGAQVTMLDDRPTYQLMVPRSFCLSFWDWLISSSSEYGVALA